MKQITKRLLATTLAMLCLLALAACSSKDDDHTHSFGEWKTINAATCTQDGSEERTCDTCGEKETRVVTVTGHSYTVELVKEETLKAAATCVTANEYYKSCACGAISDSQTFFDGQALGHNYVNNVCTRCDQQQVECDHTQLHEETMDLSQYGVCTEKIPYQTCVCRQVKKVAEDFDLDCIFYESEVTHVSEAENKDLHIKQESNCSVCGMHMCLDMQMKADPTTGKRDGTGVAVITWKKDDQVIFDATVEGTLFHYGEFSTAYSSYRMIELDQYGACEGVLFVAKSYSGVEYIRDLISECDIDLNKVPEPVVTTDANGVEHKTYTASCSKCGLKFVDDFWKEKVDDCTSVEHIDSRITCGDKTIFTGDDQYEKGSHQWEITDKQLLGNTCEDGVKWTRTCSVCHKSQSGVAFNHASKTVKVKDYLTTDCSLCSNLVSVNICEYCEKVTGFYDLYQLYNRINEDITDGNGQLIGTRATYTCQSCQMKYVEENKNVSVDACHSVATWHQYACDAQGQCLIDAVSHEYEREKHDCDYQYYLMGEGCGNGYVMCGTCKNCNETIMDWDVGHEWKQESIDKADDNCGTISYRKCAVCGKVELLDMDNTCDFEVTDADSYTDGDGVVHETSTSVCKNCGLTVKYVGTSTTDGCITTRVSTVTISRGDTVLLTCEQMNTDNTHDYEVKKYLVGDTCKDGVYVVNTCKKCNEEYIYRGNFCASTSTIIELSDYGFCGGRIEHCICDVCESESWEKIGGDPCNWEPQSMEDGYEVYQCSSCGGTRKEKVTQTPIDACHTKIETTYVYQGTTGDPITFTTTETVENHDYNWEYRLNGETCKDGWTAAGTCTVCGDDSISFSGSSHDYEAQDVYLSQYGLCGEHLLISECDICHNKSVSIGYSECDWEHQGTDANGYDVYECSKCHITKLEKQTTSDKDEHCYITYERTIIYRNGAEELYRITAVEKWSDHNYSYTYDPETPDCSSDEWYDYIATCKDCNHTENGSTHGHHRTDFNRVPIGDCGCCVYEDICDICKETVSYWPDDSDCSWGAFTTNAEGYSVCVCSECGLIRWKKWDKNSQTTEYVFFDKNNVELYRCTV